MRGGNTMGSLPSTLTQTTAAGVPPKKGQRRHRRTYFPYLLVAPALLLTIWIIYPFILAIRYSLENYVLSNPLGERFIGLNGYWNLLHQASFWHTVWVTIAYTICSVSVELLLGLVLAFLLFKETRINKVLTTLMMLPLMVAPVLASLMWKLMTNPVFGLANFFLSFIGQRNFPWASAPQTALLTVVMVDVWIYTPFMGILLLAGLRALPQAPFEAAQLEDVSAWFTFRRLTLPLMKPYIITAVLFRLLAALQTFDIIYAMTTGGPGDALMNFQVEAYTQAFVYLNLGTASALLIVLWVITYIVSQRMVTYWSHDHLVVR
jgi:multiple sugar transport system permease protein